MKRLSEYLFLGTLGGTLYYSFEMIFRGFSHWSMFLLGGVCLVFFAQQGIWTGWREPLWKQVIWCAVFVTSCEFITGIFVNKVMHWNVWDYTDQPFQLMGHYIFRIVRSRNPSKRISAPFSLRREETGISCIMRLSSLEFITDSLLRDKEKKQKRDNKYNCHGKSAFSPKGTSVPE